MEVATERLIGPTTMDGPDPPPTFTSRGREAVQFLCGGGMMARQRQPSRQTDSRAQRLLTPRRFDHTGVRSRLRD